MNDGQDDVNVFHLRYDLNCYRVLDDEQIFGGRLTKSTCKL